MMEYSELVRARMVRRMVGPGALSGAELARETGIPQPTLSRWKPCVSTRNTDSTASTHAATILYSLHEPVLPRIAA